MFMPGLLFKASKRVIQPARPKADGVPGHLLTVAEQMQSTMGSMPMVLFD
jgi:hypothetical protein